MQIITAIIFTSNTLIKRLCLNKKNTAFTHALSKILAPFIHNNDRPSCVKREAIVMAKYKELTLLMCFFSVSTILKRRICSYYPEGGRASVIKFMNGEIKLKGSCQFDDILHILWSRDSTFNITRNVPYQPNHFVPLLVVHNFLSNQN